MKKLRPLHILFGLSALFIGAFILINSRSFESDKQIKAKLRCDRNTLEELGTDYYCNHLDTYRKDLKEGRLLDENWTKAQEQLQERGLTE